MFTVSGQALGRVAETGCEISILREFQKSEGEGPKHTALISKVTLF